MPRSKSIFAILLALSSLFCRAQGFLGINEKIVIGYASLPADEAKDINKDNRIYVQESALVTQLGAGFHMINDPKRLPSVVGTWYCAIKAKREQLDNIGMVYIPQSYEKLSSRIPQPNEEWPVRIKQKLWFESEEVILRFLISTALTKYPHSALRFSWVSGVPWQLQMVVPMDVVNSGELKLWGKCFKSKKDLEKYSDKVIDWDDAEEWPIRGLRGPPDFLPVPGQASGSGERTSDEVIG
ncbi:hypothetical protein LZ554_005353 [Drepanopeziza brunnea f. sp. 'monogermtubi']|nr:hypothetical protein LZ554_005353 [Drepanopeziza brunnea f. sp. 'monogermtubi']